MNAVAPKLRIAVFGAGLAWAPHRASLHDLSDRIELGWLVGQTLERVQLEAAHFAGARATTSIDEVLEDQTVQAALVLTPPSTHLEIVKRLAARGIHILLEKPLDVDAARAETLVRICEQHDVVLAVVLQHRLRPAAQRFKQLSDLHALGPLTNAAVDIRWWRPQSYYDVPGRGTKARDGGGVLLTQAIHTLDLFLYLAGPAVEVTALVTTSQAHDMECEDVVTAALRLPEGGLATINATTAAFPGFPERIELSGTRGTATLVGGELTVRWTEGLEERVGAQAALGSGADPMAFGHEPHRAVLADFVQAVSTRSTPIASGRCALTVHQLIDALLESSRTRRFVPLTSSLQTHTP
jgi:UDP-N-acetyl-2-amino-2-deoxyglucuronate dehydrogenase